MINKELPACRSCARWPGSKIACQRFGRTIESLLPKCLESRLLSCCSTLTGVAMKCGCKGPHSGCAPSFASTDALPERGGNPFLIGACKPQGSRGRTLPSAPRSWSLDASHSCPGACDFRATSMIGITGCAPTVERTSQNRGWARMGSSVRKEKARPAQARRAECVQRCQRCMTPPARPRLSEPLIRSNRGHMPMVAVTLAPGQRP